VDIATKRAQELRSRYLTEAVQTATPAGRLVMLYDQLELDLLRADQAFEVGTDLKEISDRLIHAQEIILTLRETVNPDVWDGAPRLIALYDYLNAELLGANLDKDRQRAANVADHVRQLATAWRQAASQVDGAEANVGAA
jgi:flagellar secretion chaperone FliS